MPPPKAKAQPEAAERALLIGFIERTVDHLDCAEISDPGEAMARRLCRGCHEAAGIDGWRGRLAGMQDFTDDVYIPISTLWTRIGDIVVTRGGAVRSRGRFWSCRKSRSHVDKSTTCWPRPIVRHIVAAKHRIADYSITVPLDLLEQAKTTRLMFIVFMGLIAAISLIVGGIGIMNIMLATVTEPTARSAFAASSAGKRGDITRQFLVETIVLSIVGGLTGVLGGLTCGWVTDAVRDPALNTSCPR